MTDHAELARKLLAREELPSALGHSDADPVALAQAHATLALVEAVRAIGATLPKTEPAPRLVAAHMTRENGLLGTWRWLDVGETSCLSDVYQAVGCGLCPVSAPGEVTHPNTVIRRVE